MLVDLKDYGLIKLKQRNVSAPDVFLESSGYVDIIDTLVSSFYRSLYGRSSVRPD